MEKPTEAPRICPDCGVKPGQPHKRNCDVERCSVCGSQRIGCECKGHDKAFSRWTGYWPGHLESKALGSTLNDLYSSGLYKNFFIKPKS